MTKKERKKIATELAKLEIVIHASHDEFAKREAELRTIKLTSKIDNFEDMEAIDEMVPTIMKSLIENAENFWDNKNS